MGLFVLAGLLSYILVGIAVLISVGVSAWRAARVHSYWTVATAAALFLPLLLLLKHAPQMSRGEYAGFIYFLGGAFSVVNTVCFIGGLVCLVLAISTSDRLRLMSGVSWGFLSTYGMWIVILLIRSNEAP